MRSIAILCFVALTAATVLVAQTPSDPHAPMSARGAQAMGFDQDKTTHHFYLFPDGGAIDVSVKDASDETNLDAIRAHLPHITTMFGAGNFDTPMLVHGTDVPGTAEMSSRKDRIKYTYVQTKKGGRVDIVTSDPVALEAVYAFLRFQISDHKTGDTLAVHAR
jgi:hypothetical protein